MGDKNIKLPNICPSCSHILKVSTLICKTCNTSVKGDYDLPLLANLSNEDQLFIVSFVKYSGSLKEMSKFLNLSYPSVRNILDDIITKIKNLEKNEKQ